MRNRIAFFFAALLFLLGGCLASRAGDAVFYFSGSRQDPQAIRGVNLYYLGPLNTVSTNIVTLDRIHLTSGTNGFVGITNYLAGVYRSEFQGVVVTTTNYYDLPATNGTVNANDWTRTMTNGLNGTNLAYTTTAADARYDRLFTNTATVFVDTNGNNSTAIRGVASKPYAGVSNALTAGVAGDTLNIVGTYVFGAPTLPNSVLSFTNRTLRGYGSLFINNDTNSTKSYGLISPNNSRIYGLTITNANDKTLLSSCIGFDDNAGLLTLPNMHFEVFDFIGYGDFAVVSLYSTNFFTSDWYNSTFYGGHQGFIAGAGYNRFFNCNFLNYGLSTYADQPAVTSYDSWSFASDGRHLTPDHSSTNELYSCRLISQGELVCYALEIEWHSQCSLWGSFLNAEATNKGNVYDTAAIHMLESRQTLYLNNCVLRFGGGTNSNYAIDMGGDTNNTVFLNNTVAYWDGTNSTAVIVNCPGSNDVIYVSGGNWVPSNFSDLNKVRWLTPPAYTWAGNSGNATVAQNQTAGYYFAPNAQLATAATTDASAGTRATVTHATTLGGLRVTTNPGVASGQTYTFTIMTNGVASSIVATVTGTASVANDNTHYETIVGGVEVGVRLQTSATSGACKASWSFEGR